MPIKVLMPALSPTMTEGTLAKWHVKEGDSVSSGQVMAEIETDKATMEVEAVDEGKIGKILIKDGTQNVKVNELIAVLLEDGETDADLKEFLTAANDQPAAKADKPAEAAKPASPAPQPVAPVVPAAPAAQSSSSRVFASPLAKRIAQDKGIDLAQVKGSGPRGRIVKADVENFTPAAGGIRGQITVEGDTPKRIEVPSTMRQVIAKRLVESKQTVPHFYLDVDCEIDRLLDVRKQLNDASDGAYKISVNDMVIKAAALALKKVPEANASWINNEVHYYERADISMAVAIDGGLITPIVKGADIKGLVQISEEAKELAAKARANKLAPHEFQGGTFSISNLGMFGIKSFSAIINPPQGCILAVGAGEERAVVKSGQLAIANVMSVTLSVDHRVVDGAVGAEYLKEFKRFIEQPALLLI